ncbi:hypothetical protein [Streptomyces sp. NPDC023588]|uniref:hypothetical protein n=1 Tax=Streptomyces sp. NPDC023588 TaxID=3154907 RepID=UPI0033FC2539
MKAPPKAVGFTGLEPAPGVAPAPKPSVAAAAATAAGPAPGSARSAGERKAKERARAAADRTAREAEEAEEELAWAEKDLAQIRTGLGALDERITDLQKQLDQARRERTRISTAEEAAARRHQQAGEELKRVRALAQKAERSLSALDSGQGPR